MSKLPGQAEIVIIGGGAILARGAEFGLLKQRDQPRLAKRAEGVDEAWLDAGRFEIEAACERSPAIASLRPMHDPGGEPLRK
jgi:hypothetical protein